MGNIPIQYQNLPGYGTVYGESELRQAIALAEVLTTTATAGDASAANQRTIIALESEIRDRLPLSLGSKAISATGNQSDQIIISEDCQGFKSISLQILGDDSAYLNLEVSNDNESWQGQGLIDSSDDSFQVSLLTNKYYYGELSFKYFRIKVVNILAGDVEVVCYLSNSSLELSATRIIFSIKRSLDDINFRLAYVARDDTLSNKFLINAENQQRILNILDNAYDNDSLTFKSKVINPPLNPGTQTLVLASSVTEPITGLGVQLPYTYKNFTIQLSIFVGSLTSIDCDIQGSIDGTKWQTLATLADSTDGAMLVILNVPCLFVRASIKTVDGTPGFNFSIFMVATV